MPLLLGDRNRLIQVLQNLLILCDELQEWNREAYGILDKKLTQAGEASLVITEKKISPYLVPYDELSEEIEDHDRDTVRNTPTCSV